MPRIVERGLIPVPVLRKLPQPVSDQDMRECRHLAEAVRTMEVDLCHLHKLDNKPAALIRYSGGKTPEQFWHKWLWGKIVPQCCEFGWLGRLAAINRHDRELILIPRPCTIDESMAECAIAKCTQDRTLGERCFLVLSLIYPPHQYSRHFPPLH